MNPYFIALAIFALVCAFYFVPAKKPDAKPLFTRGLLADPVATVDEHGNIKFHGPLKDAIDKQPVQWLGYIVYATPYKGIDAGFYGGSPPPTQWTDTGHELGLRSDGVVVWREVKP